MKTFGQIREEVINTKRLTQLVRAGLVDTSKLTLLKRMLNKDVTKLTPREKAGMSELLDNILDQVLDNNQVFNKVRTNLQTEDKSFEVAGDLPTVLVLKRKAIRTYPDGQRVALYYNQKLNTFVSIPYAGMGVASASNQIAVREETDPPYGKIVHIKHEGKTLKALQVHDRYYLDHSTAKDVVDKHETDWKGKPIKNTFRYVTDSPQSWHMKHGGKLNEAILPNPLKKIRAAFKPEPKIPRPARPINENVHGALKAIVANKQTMPVRFPDGTMRVDHTTANKIINIHGAVNDENKEKMVAMMNKSKAHFLKLAKFAHNH